MTPTVAADLFRSALWTALVAGAPLLSVLTAIAILFGILQAATQVQDSAVGFTPKLAAALGVTWLSAAWFTGTLATYIQKTLSAIPWVVAR